MGTTNSFPHGSRIERLDSYLNDASDVEYHVVRNPNSLAMIVYYYSRIAVSVRQADSKKDINIMPS